MAGTLDLTTASLTELNDALKAAEEAAKEAQAAAKKMMSGFGGGLFGALLDLLGGGLLKVGAEDPAPIRGFGEDPS